MATTSGTMNLFRGFFRSERAGGFILIGCTLLSLLLANSPLGEDWVHFWHQHLNLGFLGLDYTLEHWVNDGLMAVFFLLVGLEIERELYIGELSTIRNAMLPIVAAIGGMAIPALIHFLFNKGTVTQPGIGIPMATDIAFALGILSLAGRRVPVSLKIFLTALAIIDDLGAITVIAIFYTQDFQLWYFLGALAVFALLYIMGLLRVYRLLPYLLGGLVMWFFMLKSGVHATIAGVLLAFTIPFARNSGKNISYNLQHALHKPVAFGILPIFALANTALIFPANIAAGLVSVNSLGIILGLFAGKFIGIYFGAKLAAKTGLASLPVDIKWRHLAGVAFLGGIGFTMSIFISNLAFSSTAIINESKISILVASLLASVAGLVVLRWRKRPTLKTVPQ